ncbi:hypothetical protein [Mucilaginibacter gotjawali]|uniref:Uncharacterized protein n=2 Tax=Mucilaginibacter gotjawali TaxID=1550579 RepID=A0A120MXQ1_9SPHI|nr:hypothetical protein [Mucilaginibacter gotjawali]MBB3054242.1 hypothetical protein [Mucilaginibacter gotjawali]BAU51925.1 hypothetical protein MgSA37_00074 [Mucilaginibacter gotjawali]
MKKITKTITRIREKEDVSFVVFISLIVGDVLLHFFLFITNFNF